MCKIERKKTNISLNASNDKTTISENIYRHPECKRALFWKDEDKYWGRFHMFPNAFLSQSEWVSMKCFRHTSDIVMLYSNDATSRMNEHWCWSLPTYTYELHPTAIIQNNSKQNAMRIAAFLCSMQLDSCSARRLCPTLLMFHTECPMSVQSSIYTEWLATIVSNEMQCIYLLLFFFIHFSQS